MWSLFGSKKRVENLRKEIQGSFENVKEDMGKVGNWINNLDERTEAHNKDLEILKTEIKDLKEAIEDMRTHVSFINPGNISSMSKRVQTTGNKQTNSPFVQTVVQTAVQTGNFDQLTMMERAIVFVLLNNEGKMSYEDLAIMLGKDKGTIRGQINIIKQKNPGLIEEIRELTGKKRVYISEKNKNSLLKTVKVRVKGAEKGLKGVEK